MAEVVICDAPAMTSGEAQTGFDTLVGFVYATTEQPSDLQPSGLQLTVYSYFAPLRDFSGVESWEKVGVAEILPSGRFTLPVHPLGAYYACLHVAGTVVPPYWTSSQGLDPAPIAANSLYRKSEPDLSSTLASPGPSFGKITFLAQYAAVFTKWWQQENSNGDPRDPGNLASLKVHVVQEHLANVVEEAQTLSVDSADLTAVLEELLVWAQWVEDVTNYFELMTEHLTLMFVGRDATVEGIRTTLELESDAPIPFNPLSLIAGLAALAINIAFPMVGTLAEEFVEGIVSKALGEAATEVEKAALARAQKAVGAAVGAAIEQVQEQVVQGVNALNPSGVRDEPSLNYDAESAKLFLDIENEFTQGLRTISEGVVAILASPVRLVTIAGMYDQVPPAMLTGAIAAAHKNYEAVLWRTLLPRKWKVEYIRCTDSDIPKFPAKPFTQTDSDDWITASTRLALSKDSNRIDALAIPPTDVNGTKLSGGVWLFQFVPIDPTKKLSPNAATGLWESFGLDVEIPDSFGRRQRRQVLVAQDWVANSTLTVVDPRSKNQTVYDSGLAWCVDLDNVHPIPPWIGFLGSPHTKPAALAPGPGEPLRFRFANTNSIPNCSIIAGDAKSPETAPAIRYFDVGCVSADGTSTGTLSFICGSLPAGSYKLRYQAFAPEGGSSFRWNFVPFTIPGPGSRSP